MKVNSEKYKLSVDSLHKLYKHSLSFLEKKEVNLVVFPESAISDMGWVRDLEQEIHDDFGKYKTFSREHSGSLILNGRNNLQFKF